MRLLFTFLFVLGGILCNFDIRAQIPDLSKNWSSADDKSSIKFVNTPIGKKFTYRKDTLRLSGDWELNGNSLALRYTWQGLSADTLSKQWQRHLSSRLAPPPQNAPDSLQKDSTTQANASASHSTWEFPLPLTLNIVASDENKLVLKDNNGQSLEFSYQDKRSAIGKLLDNGILRGIIGILGLIGICYLFSRNRRAINWRTVISAILLQAVFAVLVLKVPFVRVGFEFVSSFFVAVLSFTRAGASFLFGSLITQTNTIGYIFAFQVLPTVIFFSALSSLLYYIGVLQKIVGGFAWIMSRTMNLSGAESLSAAANIFMGQTEAPLLIKPYVPDMTRSELLCVMTGGMATIAGGVFAAYVGFLGGTDPAQQLIFATHLLTASVMSAPAAIMASKILLPETEQVRQDMNISSEKIGENFLDAIANGTTEGLKLAVNVGAMLLVFIAMMAMLNSILNNLIGHYTGLNNLMSSWTDGAYQGFNLEFVFGLIGAPIAWLMGTPSEDILAVGRLLGEKTIINEFVAYTSLGTMKDAGILINEKSIVIAIYALCGFSNFSSIGIQIGGIGSLAPSRRPTIASLGLLSLLGGSIACFMTATIAGMLF